MEPAAVGFFLVVSRVGVVPLNESNRTGTSPELSESSVAHFVWLKCGATRENYWNALFDFYAYNKMKKIVQDPNGVRKRLKKKNQLIKCQHNFIS